MAPCCERALQLLEREPMALIHGDTDWGNAVPLDQGVSLIDWERVQLGPAALDLGRPAECIALPAELASYREAFHRISSIPLSSEDLTRWVALGECIDSMRWISYFITARHTGQPLEGEWEQHYYRPCLERLRRLRAGIYEDVEFYQ